MEKEASETLYWLELLDESNIGPMIERQWLLGEREELLAIFTAIGKTAKSNFRQSKGDSQIRNPRTQIRMRNP